MADIRFETGLREFTLNKTVTVYFVPTDMTFIEKVYNALDTIDKIQEKYKDELSRLDGAEIFEVARRMDREAKEIINSVFDTDVCTPLFGEMSSFAVADGFPVWANLLLAIIDQLDGAFAEEKKKTNPRIAKYTAKYKKK